MFFKHFKLIESITQLNLVYPYRTLVLHDYLVLYHPSCTSFMSQFSSITIIYLILGVRSDSFTFLVPMSANCRPPSHQSIFCILHFYSFLTEFILLAMCMVCLVSLPFLAIQVADLLYKTIKGASYGTIYGLLCSSSWINILKCDKAIPEVHAVLYLLSAMDWETGHGTCVPWSIVPPGYKKMYAPVLLPVSGKSYQLESEKSIKWFLVLRLAGLKISVTSASFRSA